MRLSLLLLASALVAFNAGCSSDESGPTAPADRSFVCVAAGGYCAGNIPFTCRPGSEVATDDERKNACGKSIGDDPRDVPCCLPVPEQDTGTADTGSADADASSDGGDATPDATDGASDAADAG